MASHPEIERFEARLPSKTKDFLRHAAELTGRTLTDFVINSAYETALKVIKEHEVIDLSLKDRDLFVQALLNPPKPSSALKKAAKNYKKDVEPK